MRTRNTWHPLAFVATIVAMVACEPGKPITGPVGGNVLTVEPGDTVALVNGPAVAPRRVLLNGNTTTDYFCRVPISFADTVTLTGQCNIKALAVGRGTVEVISTTDVSVKADWTVRGTTATGGGLQLSQISPQAVTLTVTETLQFTGCTVTGHSNTAVKWRSTDTNRVTVDSITGIARARAQGSAQVQCIARADTNLQRTALVAINPGSSPSLQITPIRPNMVLGSFRMFRATKRDASGAVVSTGTCVWSVSNAKVVVSGNADSTNARADSLGTSRIRADCGGLFDTTTVTVTATGVASITANPDPINVGVGQSRWVKLTYWNTDNVAVACPTAWSYGTSSNDFSIAASTVDSVLVTGGSSAPRSASLIAICSGVVRQVAVNVSTNPATLGSLTPNPVNLVVGGTQQMTLRDANGNAANCSSASYTSGNAGVASISSSGLVTGVANGTTTVTGSGCSLTGTATVNVGTTSSGFVITLAAATVPPGGTQQLTPVCTNNGASATCPSLTYGSSNNPVATVNSAGLVSVASSATSGQTATISACGNNVCGTALITVGTLTGQPTLTPNPINVAIGGTQQTTFRDAAGNTVSCSSINHSSSNTSIATIGNTGLVTGVAVGNATVTASGCGISATATVNVTTVSGNTALVWTEDNGQRMFISAAYYTATGLAVPAVMKLRGSLFGGWNANYVSIDAPYDATRNAWYIDTRNGETQTAIQSKAGDGKCYRFSLVSEANVFHKTQEHLAMFGYPLGEPGIYISTMSGGAVAPPVTAFRVVALGTGYAFARITPQGESVQPSCD